LHFRISIILMSQEGLPRHDIPAPGLKLLALGSKIPHHFSDGTDQPEAVQVETPCSGRLERCAAASSVKP
jgi:hypothetical protein